jgi:hypothetical protein
MSAPVQSTNLQLVPTACWLSIRHRQKSLNREGERTREADRIDETKTDQTAQRLYSAFKFLFLDNKTINFRFGRRFDARIPLIRTVGWHERLYLAQGGASEPLIRRPSATRAQFNEVASKIQQSRPCRSSNFRVKVINTFKYLDGSLTI